MICTVVGARPNFIKMAPIILEARRRGLPQVFVHTGQHYDAKMSAIFFDELGMPQPDVYLGVGSGTHAEQTARVIAAFEPVLLARRPRIVVVAGDVNSTLACALTAAKLTIPVAHVEAGLRSFDRAMPEEINRVLTDHISDVLFITEPSGTANLLREGLPPERMHFVGNTMIDTLVTHREAAVRRAPWVGFGLPEGGYTLVTLHRPSNVDDPAALGEILAALAELARSGPVLFPVHPRTRARMAAASFAADGLRLVDPLGYLDFLGLMARARLVVTDSGGIQEETTALGVPCVTVRENTERPVTIERGTNRLSGRRAPDILAAAAQALAASGPGSPPELWDGHAAPRVVDILQRWINPS